MNKQHEFNEDLVSWFIEANIPLKKLDHPSIKRFISKWTGKKPPHRTTLSQRYVKPIFDKRIEKIREVIGKHILIFQIDETTDTLGRFVCNITVAPFNGEYHPHIKKN